jgi:hypothetical protein
VFRGRSTKEGAVRPDRSRGPGRRPPVPRFRDDKTRVGDFSKRETEPHDDRRESEGGDGESEDVARRLWFWSSRVPSPASKPFGFKDSRAKGGRRGSCYHGRQDLWHQAPVVRKQT